MATIEEVRSKLKERLGKFKVQTPTRVAYLGDGRGNATSNMVPVGEPNKFWARESLDGDKPFKITNKNPNLTPAFNLPVLLGYPEHDPETEQVLGLHSALIKLDAGGNVSGSSIGGTSPHHQKHEWGGGDTVYVDPRMFKPGLVSPTTPVSMRVKVLAFQHYYNFWRRYDGGVSPDLTQYVPDSDYRYVILCLDPDTNQLVVHPGSVFTPDLSIDSIISNQATNTFRHIPVPPGNEIPLGVVLLEPSTTKVNWNPEGVNNLMPMRILLSSPMKEVNERLSLIESATGISSLPQTGAANTVENDLLPGRIDGSRTRLVLNRSGASENLPALFVGELGYSNSTPSALVIGTASGNKLIPFGSGGGGGASVLGDLEDVSIGTLNYYNVLAWDYSASMWKPASQIYAPELTVIPESGNDIARFSENDVVFFSENQEIKISGTDGDLQRWGGESGGEMLIQINTDGADMRQEWLYADGSIAAEYYSEFETLNYFRFATNSQPSALVIKHDQDRIVVESDFHISLNGTPSALYTNRSLSQITFLSPETIFTSAFTRYNGASLIYQNQQVVFETGVAPVGVQVSQDGRIYFGRDELSSATPFYIDYLLGQTRFGGTHDFTIATSANNSAFVVDKDLGAVQIGTSVAGQIADFREHLIEFNKNQNDTDTVIRSSGNASMFVVDAGNDRIGIGTGAPNAKLEVVSGALAATNYAPQIRLGLNAGEYQGFYSTTANVFGMMGGMEFDGTNYTARHTSGALLTLAAVDGSIRFYTNSGLTAGNTFTPTERVRIYATGGVVVGAPAGGDKGSGTINVATNIYRNNTAYNNPDYALEHWATGKIEKFKDNDGAQGYYRLSIDESKEYVRKNLRLPRITDEPAGIFDMADIALEKIEEAHIYIYELHDRIKALEAKIAQMEKNSE